jgi:hypothetical protein
MSARRPAVRRLRSSLVRLLTRAAVGLVAWALFVFAIRAGDDGIWLLTTDDTEGGAFLYGLIVFPAAVLSGILGFALLFFVTRR